jgi:hypothetical protein
MDTIDDKFPQIPELGRENTYYGKVAHKAEKQGDLYTRAAYKVAQYITLAKEATNWPEKEKYLRHAIEKHAHPKPPIDDDVWAFYNQLKEWVQREAGIEARKLTAFEDESYTERVGQGEPKFRITSEAAQFFRQLLGQSGEQPEWFNEHDYRFLRLMQQKWA